MKLFSLWLLLAVAVSGCQTVSYKENPSRIRDSENVNYQNCLKQNPNDPSQCAKQRQQYLERQEIELMDNNG